MTTIDLDQSPEVKPEVVFLGKILERVMEGRMLVPEFQRPFIWRQPDMLALLDSVRNGYPIGSLLLWETSQEVSPLKRVGPIPVTPRHGSMLAYILDGHQRVATLLGTLMLSDDLPNVQHDVDWRIYFDLETLDFVKEPMKKQERALEPQHFPVRKLLSTAGYLEACREIQEKVTDRGHAAKLLQTADRLANAFRNYSLPLISVSEGDMDTAVTVFARLNRSGRKMSPDEMVSALTYTPGEFHLAAELDGLQEEIAHRGFAGLNRIFPLRAVLAAMDRDIYARAFADLLIKPELRRRLPDAVEATKQGVHRAIDCLRRWGVTSDRMLPYGLQLVFLAEFFRRRPEPPQEDADRLERWFWVTSFTGWFGGVNSTQARLALDEVCDLAAGSLQAFARVDLDEPAGPFPSRFDTRSARVRTYLLYLASLGPRSLQGDGALDPGALHAELGSKALAYIVGAGLPADLQSSPANRMYVDRDHRGQALRAVQALDDADLDSVLASHGFPPESKAQLRDDDREALIRGRLQHLINGERAFMQERSVVIPPQEIEDPIADSDVSDTE